MDLSQLPVEDGFRQRGEQVTRLETFIDAAFAFAVTLLVVSFQSMPHDFDTLYDALRRLPAFVAGFVILALFWRGHDRFSRRTGLEDGTSRTLGLALVAAMLFYVYPLRMVMSAGMHFLSGGWAPSELTVASFDQFRFIFVLYGVGFATLAAIMALLNRHALRRADALGFDAAEKQLLRGDVLTYQVLIATALLSAGVSLAMPQDYRMGPVPGVVYSLLGVVLPVISRRNRRRVEALVALRSASPQ
jgi:uncharacterized membrane protein